MLKSARDHQKRQKWLEKSALRATARYRGNVMATALLVAHYRFVAATDGAVSTLEQLHEQDLGVWPDGVVNVADFAGAASDGRPLTGLMAQATNPAGLGVIVRTQLADANRTAESLQIVATPRVGYVRMVEPGACSRCIVLAGRFYRWNRGFMRHPNCVCTHIPSLESDSDDFRVNPYEYFNSMSPEEQDRVFTKAGAEAIRDGADMSQVVNARRGMTRNGVFTTEGTTSGHASTVLRPGQRRMTPESIYAQARGNREVAQQLLREHGYILPAGQVPGGALVGQREGYGALGGGGRRRAASRAVEEARRTGVRNPNSRYTMTAAERRLHDARIRYETALRGIDPYSSPGFSSTPDPTGLLGAHSQTRPATQRVVATAKSDYLRWLKTNGEIYTP